MTPEDRDEKIAQVEKFGKHARGRKEYLMFLHGEHLTLRQRSLANCYECNGYYADGKEDCKGDSCAFYPVNPYNPNKEQIRGASDVPRKGPTRSQTGATTG
jgi:hypothetical protein